MSDAHPVLAGFGVSGYRSFTGELTLIGPLGRLNLLAGQNNSGKSNVLRALKAYASRGARPVAPSGLDAPQGYGAEAFEFAIARQITDEQIDEVVDKARQNTAVRRVLKALFESEAMHLIPDDLTWFRYDVPTGTPSRPNRQQPTLAAAQVQQAAAALQSQSNDLRTAASALTGGAGNPENNVERLLGEFSPLANPTMLPRVESVDAFRQIRPGGDDAEVVISTGENLIQGLQRLERPSIDKLDDKARFENINIFVQRVLDDGSARIEIPSAADTIHVRRGGLTLPLENLGTGVHQVVILAAAATLLDDTLVCMEEPEVHLHPLLQRKLVRYLEEKTANQYVIATHSAHLLDFERANVFHVQHTGQGTEVTRAGTPQQLSDLCADLGYRPSDLLQANSVLWVEGPSDRVYLRHWIRLMDESLVEGIHYSIMFYGGRLLNHLTARDPEVDEFISLRRLNRHIGILIDSDKTKPQERINTTKARVRDEFEAPEYPGFAWVTDGRTIENYVPRGLLNTAVTSVHPGVRLTYDDGKWSDPLATTPKVKVDKIRIAHAACDTLDRSSLDHRDLRKRLGQVVQFIRQANGL